MIEIKNVVKQYGNNRVIDDVSLRIEKGKITSFIGPSMGRKEYLTIYNN